MGFQFSVQIRTWDGKGVDRVRFETAVAYLKVNGYVFHGEAKVWTSTLEEQLGKRAEGQSLVELLRSHSIEVDGLGYIDVRPFYALAPEVYAPRVPAGTPAN